MYVNVSKVRGKMAEHGYTITSFAKKLGISRNTLSIYLREPEKIPYNVVSAMANILCDSAEEAGSIFFCSILT